MAKRGRRRRRPESGGQLCVVVRVDVVVYVLVGVIAALALASIVMPVELALIGSLGTLLAGILTGWLTYMRLAARRSDEGDDEPDEAGEVERRTERAD